MDDCGKAMLRVIGNSQRELRLPRFVERVGDLLLEALGPLRIQVDRRHLEAAATEGHRAGAGLTELDARLLERDEVRGSLRDRAESGLELLAQRAELRDLAPSGHAAMN